MLKIEKTETFGWESAIRGMRNPLNSWDKSDSEFNVSAYWNEERDLEYTINQTIIGDNDLKLMKKLASAGSDHGKFLRFINVTVDITAPLYWWKEFDTYKVGTVANSCSTMHKIHSKKFELSDFSWEHLDGHSLELLEKTIDLLNHNRKLFQETKDKKYWWQMIQLLPTSYEQKRTVQLNYQVLKAMYFARRNHKLDEWHTLCHWIEQLPYSELIIGDAE